MNNFASRAGDKLEFALKTFKVNVSGLTCADFGSSTGGFTDCLLENGANKVYAVDLAYGELDWSLRKNPKVIVMEKTNAMHVTLPEKVSIITIDVGWTKRKNILPNAKNNLKPDGAIISLIKPHYESPKQYLRGGKLMEEKIEEVLQIVRKDILSTGLNILVLVESPVLGGKAKNREFLTLLTNTNS